MNPSCLRSPVIILALSAFLGSSTLAARTLRVPADHPTIQAAIDAAANGDTVIIAPGTYRANLTLAGKVLTLDPQLDAQHRPRAGSPAIDAGATMIDFNGMTVTIDRRDFTGAAPDLGAFEATSAAATATSHAVALTSQSAGAASSQPASASSCSTPRKNAKSRLPGSARYSAARDLAGSSSPSTSRSSPAGGAATTSACAKPGNP